MFHNKLSKRLTRNIFQFIIGLILLGMSYSYVQAHEAERTNFISWLQVLKQKISQFVHSFVGSDKASDIARQQDMLRSYKELLSYLDQSKCEVSIPLDDLRERIHLLETISASEFSTQYLSYSSFASQVYSEMQDVCQLGEKK
jgi:hypothetical protein